MLEHSYHATIEYSLFPVMGSPIHATCGRAKIGVRILLCYLPTKSPWLNSIEPEWVHGKRQVLEPACVLR